MEAICKDPNALCYVRGWSYQNQLGDLRTEAPHILPVKESWPKGVTQVREQEITRAGFIPTSDHAASYLYRAHLGPGWKSASSVSAEEIAPDLITGRFYNPQSPAAHIPRWYKPVSSTEKNPLQSLQTLFTNTDIACGVASGNKAMPYFYRNCDGDDLYFVHEGQGICETELGLLAYEKGHYLWIPRGVAYRLVPGSNDHILFHMENYGEKFQKPETGFTGDAAVYYHRNIEVPIAHFVNEPGDHDTIIKANGGFTRYTFDYHPMDVIGWDGTLFPFRLHTKDIQPITSWKSHIPPSAYCTFFGNGFEVCSFVPRPVETGERSLPVPFDHINVDRDEVIFYSEGTFFSKKQSKGGSLSFHPRGPSHGPHEKALEGALKRREQEGAYMIGGLFVLVETNQPLYPTPHASKLENPEYLTSWR